MSLAQREKGKRGERAVASLIRELTGWDVRRRVRQHDGDSDLEGVPGWSIEVKNHQTATQGAIAVWWDQCTTQAGKSRPALFYRAQRGVWRVRWPLSLLMPGLDGGAAGVEWTADTSVEAWAAVARELVGAE